MSNPRLRQRSLGTRIAVVASAMTLVVGGLAAITPAMAAPPGKPTPTPTPTPTGTPGSDHPLGNLAPTPPMGWNSWNTFGCDISADLIKQSADALVSSGMAAAGYEYVNIDDCWSLHERDAEGNLVPDPAKFPEGIKGVADYVHSLGLKLGIYSSAGTTTCAGYPASIGYEEIDAQNWADWGVDLLKYDNCGDHQGLSEEERYQTMSDALAATGRDIVFSLCDWGQGRDWEWNATEQVGHYYRTTGDIRPTWDSMIANGDFQSEVLDYSQPNSWADPDMLVVGVTRFVGGESFPGLTRAESRTHLGLWAITNAPLLAGNDVRSMQPWVRDLLINPRAIQVNQDWSGQIGERVRHDSDEDVWVKTMTDGTKAVLMTNRSDSARTISVTAADLGVTSKKGQTVTDVWTGTTYSAAGTIRARLGSHDSAFFIVSATGAKQTEPLTSLETDLDGYVDVTKPFDLTVRFHNDGTEAVKDVTLSTVVPEGFVVQGPTVQRFSTVKPGGEATLVVPVKPDSTEADRTLTFSSTATWTYRNQLRTVTDTTTAVTVVPPPSGTNQVSEMAWMSSTNGWGPVERDQSVGEEKEGDGKPLTIEGVEYVTGLGAHAASTVKLFLGGECSTFSAVVGIDDEVDNGGVDNPNASVTFGVIGDGVELASAQAGGGTAGQTLSADLDGVRVLSLVVDEGPDGKNYDHADWADAKVTC